MVGHAPEELRRPIFQAVILRPVAARLLHDAEIGPGMRLLDLGCGVGDVTMLVAGTVGPSGSVIGIDRSPQAIAFATSVSATRNTAISTSLNAQWKIMPTSHRSTLLSAATS